MIDTGVTGLIFSGLILIVLLVFSLIALGNLIEGYKDNDKTKIKEAIVYLVPCSLISLFILAFYFGLV